MMEFPERAVIEFRRLTLEETLRLLQEGNTVEHYIRHQATVQLLQSLGIQLGTPGNVYIYRPGDVIIMAVLAAPQRGQEVTRLQPEDLVFYLVTVLQ